MSKNYQWFFASIYDHFMVTVEKHLHPFRKELISPLNGDILEVGVGTGVNFQYYNNSVRLVAIDPSIEMIKKARLKIPKALDVVFIEQGINDASLLESLSEHSFDAIVCTLVLCTIPDIDIAFDNFRKLLKKEGQLIVLEHIQHHNKYIAWWYDLINPIWTRVGEGCNLNRHTAIHIKNAGFELLPESREKYFKRGLPFYKAVFVKS